MDGLCRGCREDLPRLPATYCPTCALPTPAGEVCGTCLAHPPAFDRVACPLVYGYPVNALVAGLKYRRDLAFARPLAECLVQTLERETAPDLIVPMPIARGRLAERGFNQAAELARLVASEFGLPVQVSVIRRTRESAPQTGLPWKERARNVRGAFACDVRLEGKSVAVVDDVLTTGATLGALARTLKEHGAREVIGWIAARTLRQN